MPLSSSGHLPRCQRLSHSGAGSDFYQDPDRTPCPHLLLESPLITCGSPILKTLIPCSVFCPSAYQPSISSRCLRQMTRSWSMSCDVHDLPIRLNSPDKMLSTWFLSFYVSTFFNVRIGRLENDCLLPSPDILFFSLVQCPG